MVNQIEAETETAESRGQKRKRGSGPSNNVNVNQQQKQRSWRTERDHKLYSTKLITALRRIKYTQSTPLPSKSRLIREAADRVLATASRGRTRWSRAILSRPSNNNSALIKGYKRKIPSPPPVKRLQSTAEVEENKEKMRSPSAAVVERKAKVLGRLVPGCRKVELPKLLEETSDYIAALELQVRAMTAIDHLLSSAARSHPAPVTATTQPR